MIQQPIQADIPLPAPASTLSIDGLSVRYSTARVIRNVSLSIAPGEAYGLIGESGSGKSTVAFTVMRYLNGGAVSAGKVTIAGHDMLSLDERRLKQIRGPVVSMVFQDPMNALNPSIRVGEQIAEGLRYHTGIDKAAAAARAVDLIGQVKLPEPEEIAQRYPHQLSGGQQQRIVIAMALALEPALLILDEPTTGLDVTTEATILDLISEIKRRSNVALLFISHNLGVVARMCERVGVLYAGELIEEGPTAEVLQRPSHPYTRGLINAVPTIAGERELVGMPGSLPDLTEVPEGCIFRARCPMAVESCARGPIPVATVRPRHTSRCLRWRDRPTELGASSVMPARPSLDAAPVRLEVDRLERTFPGPRRLPFFKLRPAIQALRGVSLDIRAGETVAVVGESGSGKSTFGRLVAGLDRPAGGTISFEGRDITIPSRDRSIDDQRAVQFIFQNPHSALNPHHTVEKIVGRPLRLYLGLHGAELRRRTREILAAVRLGERYLARTPDELSGGEKQRVCIARAFAASPRLVVCDEPTSALDISVQAAILQELRILQRESEAKTAYMFITHDLGVVRQIADRVAVMYLGEIVEFGPTADIFSQPHHPYTEALLAAVPELRSADALHMRLGGVVPKPTNPPAGCAFHTRCPRFKGDICRREIPPLRSKGAGHSMRCHHDIETLRALQAGAAKAEPAALQPMDFKR